MQRRKKIYTCKRRMRKRCGVTLPIACPFKMFAFRHKYIQTAE